MSISSLTAADWSELEQYDDHTLSPAEQAAAEARLATEVAFRAGLTEHQMLVAGVRLQGREALRQRLRRLETSLRAAESDSTDVPRTNDVNTPVSPPQMRISWSRQWRLLAAAAVLLAGGFGTWTLFRGPDYQSIAAQHTMRDPGLPVLMGPSARPQIDKAMNAYKLRKPDEALAQWDALPVGAVGIDTLQFYRGVFLLELQQGVAAAEALARVRQLPTSVFRERADYYFAVSLWSQGRTAEAQVAFEHLLTVPGHPYADAARVALEQLEKGSF
jgi:hypothetical protein